MRIDEVSNTEALLSLAAAIAAVWVILRLTGRRDQKASTAAPDPSPTAYDARLPKFFLAGLLFLLLGSAHLLLVAALPLWPAWQELGAAVQPLSLQAPLQLIAGGAFLLLFALVYYALPRWNGRQLYSHSLADLSFLLAVVGNLLLYLVTIILSVIEGRLVVAGASYEAARLSLGNWHTASFACTAGTMSVGYWFYALNVYITLYQARGTEQRRQAWLNKYLVLGAVALMVSTIQFISQLMTDNALWLEAAGHYGNYIDPIAYYELLFVAALLLPLAAIALNLLPSPTGGKMPSTARRLLSLLAGSATLFYVAAITLGLVLGGVEAGYGGASAPWLEPFLMEAGTPLLALIAVSVVLSVGSLAALFFQQLRPGLPDGWSNRLQASHFWLAAAFFLLLGAGDGLWRVLALVDELATPAAKPVLLDFTLIGSILLLLQGALYSQSVAILGRPLSSRLTKRSLWLATSAFAAAYPIAIAATIWPPLASSPFFHLLNLLLTLPLLASFAAYFYAIWRASPQFRAAWRRYLARLPRRYNGPAPRWRAHFPARYFLATEAIFGIMGFPGMGWILSGNAFVGGPIAIISPAIVWVVLPTLMSPYGEGWWASSGIRPLFTYLVVTTALSLGALALALRRDRQEAEN